MRKLTHEEISKKRFTIEQLKSSKRYPIYVLLDNIRSLYNVGSIFRTSDAARIIKLYLCGYTPKPPRKEIEKTSLGAVQSVPWEHYPSAQIPIDYLKSQGVSIVILEQTDKSIPYYNITPYYFPLCLIVGNEIQGVSKEIINLADFAVEIPMYGVKQSLNVAVAYGITVFEFIKILNNTSNQI